MADIIYVNSSSQKEIAIYECGSNILETHSGFGPAVRDFFLIHFVTHGKGVFIPGGKTYKIEAGMGFLVCPQVLTHYTADPDEPWSYSWVGFSGPAAESLLEQAGIGRNTPVFEFIDREAVRIYLEMLMKAKTLENGRDAYICGILHLLLSQLIDRNPAPYAQDGGTNIKAQHVRRIADFLKINYEKKIALQDLSNFFGLESKYICSLFKQYVGIPPHRYLMSIRMDKACELLKGTSLTVSEVSRSVGYDDPLLFSRMFRRIKGISPSSFRNM